MSFCVVPISSFQILDSRCCYETYNFRHLTMEDNDDVYEKVKAPCWANSLQEANADVEEADDSFFRNFV